MRRHLLPSIIMLIGLTVVLGFGYPLLVTGVSAVLFRHQANGSLVYRGDKLIASSLLGQAFTGRNGKPLRRYFQPRPSAAGAGYDGSSSGTSNLGPSNPLLTGFVPGVNTVNLHGRRPAVNPFATRSDPACVPVDPNGNPVTSPARGQRYARMPDGSYRCYPATVPELAIAYRRFNLMPPAARVPIDAVTVSGSGLDPDISLQNALDQARRVALARHLPLRLVVALVHRSSDGRQWGVFGEPTVNVLKLNLALAGLR